MSPPLRDRRDHGVHRDLSANDLDGFVRIADSLDTPIVVDESGLRAEQLDHLPGPIDRWILNCRVSKMGGLLRSLGAVETARALGMGVIVGAHVGETSILTRAALTVASHAREALRAQEGAFGTKLLRRAAASWIGCTSCHSLRKRRRSLTGCITTRSPPGTR